MGDTPALVHVLDGISLVHPGGQAEPGRLEVGTAYLEFQGEAHRLRLTGIRDVAVAGETVVVTGEGTEGNRATLFDDRPGSRRRKDVNERFAAELRELVGLPAVTTGPVRVRGLAWAIVGSGFAGGFLAAGALSGGGYSLLDFLEVVYKGGFLALGALAFAFLMGQRARVPALLRWSLAVAAIAAGGLLGASGAPELAEPGPDDLHQLFGTPTAIGGEILLGLVIVTAVVLSFSRFDRGVSAGPRDARWAEGKRELAVGAVIVGVAVAAGIVGRVVAGGPSHTNVTATLRDFSITLSPARAAPGTVEFHITNQGPSPHQFWVYETDLAPDALPADPTGQSRVSEFGPGFSAVSFFLDDIPPGGTKTLQLDDVESGTKYVVICNIPGHYVRGMFAPFTVA